MECSINTSDILGKQSQEILLSKPHKRFPTDERLGRLATGVCSNGPHSVLRCKEFRS